MAHSSEESGNDSGGTHKQNKNNTQNTNMIDHFHTERLWGWLKVFKYFSFVLLRTKNRLLKRIFILFLLNANTNTTNKAAEGVSINLTVKNKGVQNGYFIVLALSLQVQNNLDAILSLVKRHKKQRCAPHTVLLYQFPVTPINLVIICVFSIRLHSLF